MTIWYYILDSLNSSFMEHTLSYDYAMRRCRELNICHYQEAEPENGYYITTLLD